MSPKILVFTGPPGSGKSTQAQLAANKYGLAYFDTGTMFRRLKEEGFSTPEMDRGELMDPLTTLELTQKEYQKIIEGNQAGISVSGSFRALDESFGKDRLGGLAKWLSDKYGKESLYFFRINLSEEEAANRNAMRGEGRQDDNPVLMETRIGEYRTRTEPVFKELDKRGYRVIDIDGAPSREEVFADIQKYLEE
ncbi:nucleoside monophosphate kinase [Patescibacteria group bacterium]|nr:nucleoside monophosphate kinase [Patescibacteria group bacterium]